MTKDTKDIEMRIVDLENRVAALEKELHSGTRTSKSRRRRNPSINEFLREKGPKTAIDMILAVAVYHDRFTGTDSFSANDLLDLIRKAKRKKPKNINDLINKNIVKGYLEEDKVGEDKKKRWYVTNSGMELVDNNFNRDAKNT